MNSSRIRLTRLCTRKMTGSTPRVTAAAFTIPDIEQWNKPHHHQCSITFTTRIRSISVDLQKQRAFSTLGQDGSSLDEGIISRLSMDWQEPVYGQVQQVLDVPMGELHRNDIAYLIPDLMNKCFELRTKHAMQKAEDLLERAIREKHVRRDPQLLPAHVVEKLLFGWALDFQYNRISLKDFKYKAMELLFLMIAESEHDRFRRFPAQSTDGMRSSRQSPCKPTTKTFNTILRGYAKSAGRHPHTATYEAMRIFQTMQKKQTQHQYRTQPNNASYVLLMTAYANADTPTAARETRRILQWMKEQHAQDRKEYQLEFRTLYNSNDPSKNQRIIVTPNLEAYSTVISAHTSWDAAMAEQLWREMMNRGIRPDSIVLTNVIHAWAQKANSIRKPQLSTDMAEHAEVLLWKMVEYAQRSENSNAMDLYPTVSTFNACLGAWAKSNSHEAAYRAEALLERMLEVRSAGDINTARWTPMPNRLSFDTVLNAWSRFGAIDTEAASKAEELLNLMYSISEERALDIEPDLESYTAVMIGWSRSDAGDRVARTRRLLDRLLDKHKSGNLKKGPDLLSFGAVIQAADRKVESVDASMTTATGFTSSSESDDDPYLLALRTYSEIENDTFKLGLAPDHMTYASILNVVGKATGDKSAERRQMLEQIFTRACKSGEVSRLVVLAMRRAAPSHDLLDRLFPSAELALNMISIDQLPANWTRNVTGNKFRKMLVSEPKQNIGKSAPTAT